VPAFLVQISDSHLRAGPDGDAAAAALEQVVAAICALPITPTAVLFSGDLTDDGAPESYARVRELIAPLPSPVHVLAGNHDDPAALQAVFGSDDEFAVGDLRLLCANTQQPGTDAGRLDVDGLAARLDDRPTVIAMHHPPLRTGIPAIDALGLPVAARAALGELLARSPQVQRVVCGHVHRVTFETLGGVGVFTCPATWEQAEPGPTGGLAFVERSAYAIHTWAAGRFVTQIQAV
jgi:Icc protein